GLTTPVVSGDIGTGAAVWYAGPLGPGQAFGSEVHGGQGDDTIYGGAGNDSLFGDGQNDVIVGGYGNDWISGGNGDDGVLGDDGRIYTSRNGLTEPLNGLLVATVQSTVATGGNVQYANINITGQLKKSVDLTPFSDDPSWNP